MRALEQVGNNLAQEQVQNALRRAAMKPRLDCYCMTKHILVPAGCFASIRRESCEQRARLELSTVASTGATGQDYDANALHATTAC